MAIKRKPTIEEKKEELQEKFIKGEGFTEKEEIKKIKKLIKIFPLHMPEDLHAKTKVFAAKKKISMQDLILSVIADKINYKK